MQLSVNAVRHNPFSAIVLALPLLLALHGAFAADATNALRRPDADVARDADRKPVEMMAFAQVKPGQIVIDYIPGKGYFTRLFSAAVGTQGAVYSVMPQFLVDKFKGRLPPSVTLEPGYTNIHDVVASNTNFNVPVKADLVWTAQNYHDVHNGAGPEATEQINKAIFDALKPGGLYVVIDHASAAGQDAAAMTRLHRIDKTIVISEVSAAGFVLDGESTVLQNPADTHELAVFDPAIRGKTDQFVLRFKKPAH